MAKTSNSPSKSKTACKAKKTTAKPASKAGGGAQTKILLAINSQAPFGPKADRKTVMGLAGMTSKGSFGTTLLNMRKKGLVEYDSSIVWLTDSGKEQVGDEAIPTTNDGIQDKLKETIKQKRSREIFDLMADGKAYTRKELADKMNMEDNKSFGTYVSALSKVSEKVDGNKIRLKDVAFPCGRPCDG